MSLGDKPVFINLSQDSALTCSAHGFSLFDSHQTFRLSVFSPASHFYSAPQVLVSFLNYIIFMCAYMETRRQLVKVSPLLLHVGPRD